MKPVPRTARTLAVRCLAGLSLTGCAGAGRSPAIDVLGSYFPAWLICIVAGLGLAVVARLLFSVWRLDKYLLPAPIILPCLVAVFALTVWLVFFQN